MLDFARSQAARPRASTSPAAAIGTSNTAAPIQFRFAIRPPLLSLRAGRGRHPGHRRQALRRRIPPVRRPAGIPAVSASSKSTRAVAQSAASISTCTRAKAKTSGSPRPPSSPASAAATFLKPRSSATSPRHPRRPGPDAVHRRRHLLPRVRPPHARDPRRPAPLGRPYRLRHRRRLRRSPLADARRVLPRRKLLQTFASHYQTGEVFPPRLVRKMKRAGSFGRATRVAHADLLHHALARPARSGSRRHRPRRASTKRLHRLLRGHGVDGNRMYASFTHLVGYSSNYYTYPFDKVIALDFFAQFDPAIFSVATPEPLPQTCAGAGRLETGPPNGARLPGTRRRIRCHHQLAK